jgi:hypothetical protein
MQGNCHRYLRVRAVGAGYGRSQLRSRGHIWGHEKSAQAGEDFRSARPGAVLSSGVDPARGPAKRTDGDRRQRVLDVHRSRSGNGSRPPLMARTHRVGARVAIVCSDG